MEALRTLLCKFNRSGGSDLYGRKSWLWKKKEVRAQRFCDVQIMRYTHRLCDIYTNIHIYGGKIKCGKFKGIESSEILWCTDYAIYTQIMRYIHKYTYIWREKSIVGKTKESRAQRFCGVQKSDTCIYTQIYIFMAGKIDCGKQKGSLCIYI